MVGGCEGGEGREGRGEGGKERRRGGGGKERGGGGGGRAKEGEDMERGRLSGPGRPKKNV